MKLDAMKRQGQRTDLTCAPVGHKLESPKSRDIVAAESGDSKSQIQRYIRLTNLIPELLNMVDENKIALRPAVELSYLSETEQNALKDAIESDDCTPSHAQAIKLRKFAEDGKLNADVILSIMDPKEIRAELGIMRDVAGTITADMNRQFADHEKYTKNRDNGAR